jgi:DNA-binding protein H-NS
MPSAMKKKSLSYADVLQQIESLKAQADRLRQAEVGDVVKRIRSAIEAYGLTAADLGFGGAVPRKAGAKGRKAAAPGAPKAKRKSMPKGKGLVKYANGAGGTWGGIGKRPQWLRDGLAAGKQLSDFLVK